MTVFANLVQLDRQQKLPVMVNIHGGLFYAMGADDYLPHYFMDQNVILVTVNYRLGLFGEIMWIWPMFTENFMAVASAQVSYPQLIQMCAGTWGFMTRCWR